MIRILLPLIALLSPAAFGKGENAKRAAAPAAASWQIDPASTKLQWEGRKLMGAHQGTLQLKSGTLQVQGNRLTGGEIVVDMSSLAVVDIKDPENNAKLTKHLKSDDFFSIEKNPTSTLKITKTELKDEKTMVSAELTIKGISKPVQFPVDLKIEKQQLQASGELKIDRTQFDIKFRSLKFFSDIGDKVINDEFSVRFELSAKK